MDSLFNIVKWILIVVATAIAIFLVLMIYYDIIGFYNPYFPYISKHTLNIH